MSGVRTLTPAYYNALSLPDDLCSREPQKYNVTSAYYYLISMEHNIMVNHNDVVWHKEVHMKIGLYAWRLLHNRIPTTNNLIRRGAISYQWEGLCGCVRQP